MTEQIQLVECRGMQCPAPVLATAKAARSLASNGGLLEIVADDDAFPADLKSWCRSSNAELLSLEETAGAYRAQVRVLPKSSVQKSGSAAAPATTSARRRSDDGSDTPDILDCRDKQCPEPILMLARYMREKSPSAVEVLANDAAFPMDVQSWCRTSNATLVEMREENGVYRALIKRAGTAAVMQPLLHAPPTSPPNNSIRSSGAFSGQVRTNLVYVPSDKLDLELEKLASNAVAGQVAVLDVADGTAAQTVVRWCALKGHEIRNLRAGTPATVELAFKSTNALELALAPAQSNALAVRPEGAPDVALLVLHNDYEALLAAMMVATAAAAQGMKVIIFYTFWGLNMLRADRPNPAIKKEKTSFFQRMFKWMMPRGAKRQQLSSLNFGGMGTSIMKSIMRNKNIADLPDLIKAAESLGITFYACTTSMTVMGITKRDLLTYEHLEFAGAATFVERARHAQLSLNF